MKRRLLLTATMCGAATALLAPLGAGAAGPPGYRVSAQQLQEALALRFPLRYAVSGLLQLTMEAPVLRFLPEANRLGADLAVQASGPALARTSSGEFDVDFGLRYERSDQSIRAHRLRVRSLRVAGLPAPYPELLDAFSQGLAQQAFGEVVLHRLRPRDLALPNAMGLEPDTITVTENGLVIGFTAQPLR